MSVRKEFTYLSSDGKTPLYGICWIPDEEPIAILQIVHGVTEYIGRYEPLARYLSSNGIIVVGADLLGHGLSYIENNKMYFGPEGSWETVVKDVSQLFNLMKESYEKLPYFIMGFSLGSFVVRHFLLENSSKVNGAIIMGTGYQSKMVTKIMYAIAKIVGKITGEDKTSKFITKLTFGTYNQTVKNPKTEYDWLSSSREEVMLYQKDEKIGGPMTAGLFRDLIHGMEVTCDKENIKKMSKDLPVLFVSGENDPVGDMTNGVLTTEYLFRTEAGIQDTEMVFFSGNRHDILHDTDKESVYKLLSDWMFWRL